ncbi:MAG: O-antigen ligase family protein [Kiritimatiellae bacterium]|nr:O-antigen ligase family protein [Kiritimatiellia bacterium]
MRLFVIHSDIQMTGKPFLKLTSKMLFFLVATILLCRWTSNYALIPILGVGVFFALSNQRGKALVFYLLLPFLTIINPLVLPKVGLFSAFARGGTLVMSGALLVAAVRSPGKQTLPFGVMYLYLVVAFVSSLQGYFPLISLLKVVNFLVFLLGIHIGTRNLHHRPEDILLLRATLFAFAILIVLGSLLTLPFPGVAYYISLKRAISEIGLQSAGDMVYTREKFSLFSGITNHSQFLAPMLACLAGWLACDMLLIEKRITRIHAILLALIPVLLFMTRSRAGFFAFLAMGIMVYFYCLPKIALPAKVKGRLSGIMVSFLVILTLVGVIYEAKDSLISRWLRKSDDLAEDTRTLNEAVTGSRQGLIEQSLNDYRRARLLGSGFQVQENHRALYDAGIINLFSASIEKGLLPLMVLGETGILGAITFSLFLWSFWIGCAQKRYIATFTLFVVFLSTNIAEATFFSPGGGGGILWMVCVVGGFLIDMTVYIERNGTQPQLMRRT